MTQPRAAAENAVPPPPPPWQSARAVFDSAPQWMHWLKVSAAIEACVVGDERVVFVLKLAGDEQVEAQYRRAS